MTEIVISGLKHSVGGPSYPREYGVSLELSGEEHYRVPQLAIYLGADRITVRPADREEIRKFALKLLALTESAEAWRRGRWRCPSEKKREDGQ